MARQPLPQDVQEAFETLVTFITGLIENDNLEGFEHAVLVNELGQLKIQREFLQNANSPELTLPEYTESQNELDEELQTLRDVYLPQEFQAPQEVPQEENAEV